jgi:deoxyribose-phosphate aldolase
MTSVIPAVDADTEELGRVLAALPPLDQAEIEDRAARLALEELGIPPRAVLDLAIRLTDLTSLEGTDNPERVLELCEQARHPDTGDDTCPPVATVCVYSDLVPVAVEDLAGSTVGVSGVAGAFPSGRAPLAVRMADVAAAVDAGADEIDLVLDRGAFLSGRYADVVGQLRALRDACGDARMKVILETAELGSITDIRDAAWLAMAGGADMVKTSTGKLPEGATLPHVLVLLEAAQAFEAVAGRFVGVKAAGGIRTAGTALRYLSLVAAVGGMEWLTRDRFRFGASSLLDDLVARRAGAIVARRADERL